MVLDIVLILILLLGVFIGYKKGFVKVLIKLTTFIISIILAFLLQTSVAEFVGDKLGFNNTISSAVENKLINITSNNEEEENPKTEISILENTIDEINNVAEEKKNDAIQKWSKRITAFVIKGISFVLIFLTVSILMGIIGLILDTVVKLPVLNTLNGTLGIIIEVLLVIIRVLIILAVISFLSPLDVVTPIISYINNSCIIKWLYENNIIISIIGRKLL